MKRILSIISAIMISASPCNADNEDFGLAVDALTGLGITTACYNRIRDIHDTDTVAFFSHNLEVLDQNFLRIYGVTLSSISRELGRGRPWEYVIFSENELQNIETQNELKSFCIYATGKFKTTFALLSLKGKH